MGDSSPSLSDSSSITSFLVYDLTRARTELLESCAFGTNNGPSFTGESLLGYGDGLSADVGGAI